MRAVHIEDSSQRRLAQWLLGIALATVAWVLAYSQLTAFANGVVGLLSLSRETHFGEAVHFFFFLISAPMVNEVALVLLFGMFGWKVAGLYLGLGLLVAIIAGLVIGKLKMERHLEDWGQNDVYQRGGNHSDCRSLDRKRSRSGYGPRVHDGCDRAFDTGDDHSTEGAEADLDRDLCQCRGDRHSAGGIHFQLAAVMDTRLCFGLFSWPSPSCR